LRKSDIKGNPTRLNTLEFYKAEKLYLDSLLNAELIQKRKQRLEKSIDIFEKKKEIINLYRLFKESIDQEIAKDKEFAQKFKMEIDVNFNLNVDFARQFLSYIKKNKRGTYLGATEKDVNELFIDRNLLDTGDISDLLHSIITSLEEDLRNEEGAIRREVSDQIEKTQEFYDFVFSLDYLHPIYELKLDGKILQELSPGEKGALLLVFYLMIDKEEIPLIIDQPEDNLDNKSVFQVLTHFIKSAKKRRQIVIVTHNPNLAVGADAEQVIYVALDKKGGKNVFSYETGSIENANTNARIVDILEGTMPAFDKRKLRYQPEV
jgi:wobble nucleotide-excising tRNase